MKTISAAAQVVRLHMRSSEAADHVELERWCLGEDGDGWAGLGWGLADDHGLSGMRWERYVRLWTERYQERPGFGALKDTVRRLHDLEIGSLVWTRRRDSSYWLGGLTGPWCYQDNRKARELDMWHLRPCRWYRVGTEDAVPCKVVNNFLASKALNPVTDPGAVRYTQLLYAELSGQPSVVGTADPAEVIGSLLGARDLEGLVAVFLQDVHDFVLVARGHSTVGYEYVLRHRKTGRHAVATVKAGEAPVDLDALPVDPEVDVWAFAVHAGNSRGKPRSDIRWITNDELVDFMAARPKILPQQVQWWLSANARR